VTLGGATRRPDLRTILEALDALDWSNTSRVADGCASALREIALRPELILGRMGEVAGDARVRSLCESYDILDKVVLWDSLTGFRLRLHVFRSGYFDRPHNHRWSYTSRILVGGYRHVLYGTPERSFSLDDLRPSLVREEAQGSCYTLDHRMVHAIEAAASPTISLVLRGPSVVSEFTVADRVTGETWTQRGAAEETEAERAEKHMTDARFSAVQDLLRHELGDSR